MPHQKCFNEFQYDYQQMHLGTALTRRCDYAQACKELAYLLRWIYREAPKSTQALMYQDVLSAFRMLSGMETIQHLSGAEVLLQAVEATFPKKKKAAAVSEYRQAAVAQHRWARQQEMVKPTDSVELPKDLLLHIFGFLDVRTLAVSSAVCRDWNETSNFDILWRKHYLSFFPKHDGEFISLPTGVGPDKHISILSTGGPLSPGNRKGVWQTALALKLFHPGSRSLVSASNRALCTGCNSLIWLSEQPKLQEGRRTCSHEQYPSRPVSHTQVLTFVRREMELTSSSSSDSEMEDDFRILRRLNFARSWSYSSAWQHA